MDLPAGSETVCASSLLSLKDAHWHGGIEEWSLAINRPMWAQSWALPCQPSACAFHLQAHLQSVNFSSRSLALIMQPVTLAHLVLGCVAYHWFSVCVIMSCKGILNTPNVRWTEKFACGLLACACWIMHVQSSPTNLPSHCFLLSLCLERRSAGCQWWAPSFTSRRKQLLWCHVTGGVILQVQFYVSK